MFGEGTRLQAAEAAAITETTADPSTDQTSLQDLIDQASRYFNQAQSAQRAGDWAEYGRSLQLLEETLKQLDENTQ